MNHAKETDFESVKEIFYQHKEWFPHIRTDYMKREIAKNFYVKNNMKLVGSTTWAKGTLPGDVYLYDR